MIYFLLVIYLGNGVSIEAYPTKEECEIRREVIRTELPDLTTQCIRMERKQYV